MEDFGFLRAGSYAAINITEDYGYGKIGIPQGGFARNFGNFRIFLCHLWQLLAKLALPEVNWSDIPVKVTDGNG
jgi:hypothetical protein